MSTVIESTHNFRHECTALDIACLRREGHLPPLLCLHGFGSTKEDYSDLALNPAFDGRDLVMFDAPGFGASSIDTPEVLSISYLVQVALRVCDLLGIGQFHLLGHSMGGLTALMLAHDHADRVLSLIDIEGNVAPEDCFLSRQIIEHPAADAETFLAGFIDRVSRRSEFSSRLYARSLPLTVRPASAWPIFTSMVDLSDNAPLMEMLTGLPCPRTFVYGVQNSHLSYLGKLRRSGVDVVEIPFSGHFPMYSNPPALWSVIADHLHRSESAT